MGANSNWIKILPSNLCFTLCPFTVLIFYIFIYILFKIHIFYKLNISLNILPKYINLNNMLYKHIVLYHLSCILVFKIWIKLIFHLHLEWGKWIEEKKRIFKSFFFFTLNNRFKRYSKYSIVWKFSRNKWDSYEGMFIIFHSLLSIHHINERCTYSCNEIVMEYQIYHYFYKRWMVL